MVPTTVDDCIHQPLTVIQRLFEEHWTEDSSPEDDWQVPAYFQRIFDTNERRCQIPLLDALPISARQPGKLVRFRGMIQDTSFGQEISIDAARKDANAPWICYRYRDDTVLDHDASQASFDLTSNHVRLNELSLLYCVSVPGEQVWAREKYIASSRSSIHEQSLNAISQSSTDTPTRLSAKHPIPEEEHSLGVVVKVLGNLDKFTISSTIEVIGILGTTIAHSDTFDADQETGPLLTCIHAIHCRSLPSATEHPYLTCEQLDSKGYLIPTALDTQQLATQTRSTLLRHFTHLLQGDELAAEYLLLAVLSRVQHRHEFTAIGDLSLNLTGVPRPPDATTIDSNAMQLHAVLACRLHTHLAAILPKCLAIPMSLSYLNAQPFWPRDTGHHRDRLLSGRLQLTDGTFLLIDETALSEGKLEANGLRNVQTLMRIAQTQQLDYEFPYRGDLSFPTDLGLLIFSSARSVIPADFIVPWRPVIETTNTDMSFSLPDTAELDRYRLYIAAMRALSHEIPEAMVQLVQDDFVQRRQQETLEQQPLTTDATLSRELLIARLLAQSFGERQLTTVHWQRARQLEAERRTRLTTSQSH